MNLYDVANDLFIYLTTFRWRVDAGVTLSLDRVQKDLQQVFHVQDVKIRQNPSLASGYNQVKYALVVFADEVILNSDWMDAVEWERDLLEFRFFDTDVGGDRFFELCEDLEMDDPQVAAIFYNCLALGFRGRYDPDAEELRQIKEELLDKCSPTTEAADTRLAPRAYAITRVRKVRKLSAILKWHHVIFVVAMLIGLYVVLDRFIIWHHYTSTINNVRNRAVTRLNIGRLPSPSTPAEVLARPIIEPKTSDSALNELADDQLLTSANLKISGKDTGQSYPEPMPEPIKAKENRPPNVGNQNAETSETALGEREDADVQDDSRSELKPVAVQNRSLASDKKSDAATGYTIQISTGYSKRASEAQIKKYLAKGYAPYLVEVKRPDGITLWLVRMGHFNVGEIDQAREAAAEFSKKEKVKVFVTNTY